MTILEQAAIDAEMLINNKFPGNGFFSATKLLNMHTKNGGVPSCYIHTVNRTAGKTTFYLLLSIILKKKYNVQSVFLVRNIDEIDGYINVFGDVLQLYYPDYELKEYVKIKRSCTAISIDGEEAFYVICIKKADTIKKFSPIFVNVSLVLLEEYQPIDGKFVKNEVNLVNSIIRSIARGGGEQVRSDCYLVLLGNPITVMNPYLISFGISSIYRYGRKYFFTESCVCEVIINESSSKAIMESGFSKLFGEQNARNDAGLDFLIPEGKYIIKKIPDKSRYWCTFIINNELYGVRIYNDYYVHVSCKADISCNNVLAFTESDRDSVSIILEKKDYTFSVIRNAYKNGFLFFDNEKTKMLIFNILGIDAYSKIC